MEGRVEGAREKGRVRERREVGWREGGREQEGGSERGREER